MKGLGDELEFRTIDQATQNPYSQIMNANAVITTLQEARNISRAKLAELAGVNRNTLTNTVRGTDLKWENMLKVIEAAEFTVILIPREKMTHVKFAGMSALEVINPPKGKKNNGPQTITAPSRKRKSRTANT